MTKDQKVKYVNDLVEESRKHFVFQEFADMVVGVWQALDNAQARATDGDPK